MASSKAAVSVVLRSLSSFNRSVFEGVVVLLCCADAPRDQESPLRKAPFTAEGLKCIEQDHQIVGLQKCPMCGMSHKVAELKAFAR